MGCGCNSGMAMTDNNNNGGTIGPINWGNLVGDTYLRMGGLALLVVLVLLALWYLAK